MVRNFYAYCFTVAKIRKKRVKNKRNSGKKATFAPSFMSTLRFNLLLALIALSFLRASAQNFVLAGTVVDGATKQPVEFASVLLSESGLWAITDKRGSFTIKNVPQGQTTLTVQCLGYQKRVLPMNVTRDVTNLKLRMDPENLKLDEVTVVAKRKQDESTTSYSIGRTTLDNQQIINLSDIATLLPGGKTVNPTLMSDNRISLRSGDSEKGNASFGTAIEVDGMRMDNNASPGETAGASTRTISASNIESVEVVTGIASVEYGDLSNGVVKVNTRKGKSPFIVEGSINQHTRQIALNKGFDLGGNKGILNTSIEHARSFSNAASPYTAYQRNILSLHYMNIFFRDSAPLTLNAGLTGNIGGYNSEADPDEELDDYSKSRDNAFRGNIELNWLPGKSWLTNLLLQGTFSYSDRRTESYSHASSASTQPYIHTMEEGYFMGADYDKQPDAPIILGPTGYWHVTRFSDSKPLSWSLKLKAQDNTQFSIGNAKVRSRSMLGIEYTGSRNNGQGTYYGDMRYAPTWREYRYDELPTLHNLAFYAEEKLSIPTTTRSTLELTAGLRDDVTMIGGSEYGTVNSLSPRFNGRYIFWRNRRKQFISDLQLHAGWGKSVKLPSFQVLYPAPAYSDRLAFSTPSGNAGTAVYAYHTYPSKAIYNPELRWQYTQQTDIGVEFSIFGGTHIALSAFHHRTCRPYMSSNSYTPLAYLYTPPSALDGCTIPVAERTYTIDRQTGQVSVGTANSPAQQVLEGNTRRVYLSNVQYVNASPLNRYGLEWTVDFEQIKALRSNLRLDGNYYYYKGTDDLLFADIPLADAMMSDGQPYQYVGYYRGSSATSASYTANAAVANGTLSKQLNLNATVTTHIPEIRLIVALRIESSLYNYRRQLSELDGSSRGIMLNSKDDYTGVPYDGSTENRYIAVYPDYYSTWDAPNDLQPFAERFLWAKDNDPVLYSDLSKLVVRSNYPYVMNPNRLSAYYSANLSVTKEIGDHVSVSFYANNFFNNMKTVHSSQTDLETSLFASSYIPSFYYGLSLRLKL
jgi:hypothetical protein